MNSIVPPGLQAITNTLFTVGLGAADPDLPRNTLRFSLVDGPLGMTVDPVSGLLSWMPGPDLTEPVAVEVAVIDDGEPILRATAKFVLNVIPATLDFADPSPTATGDTFYSDYGETVDADVLANDIGDSLVLMDVGETTGGTVEVVGNLVRFTPDDGFVGVATFTYRARQPDGQITAGTVTVVVAKPVVLLADDAATTMSGRPVAIDVLVNDRIGGEIAVFDITEASDGDVLLQDDRRVLYSPPESFLGSDRFQYTIADLYGTTRSAAVTVTVIEPALPDTTTTLTDIDIPETDVPAIAPTALSFADLNEALIDAIRKLSIPFRLIIIAGAWATLLVIGLARLGPRYSVGAITNTRRDEQVPAIDPKTGNRLFSFRSDADLIWMGRRRRRHRGSWYRKVETPLGTGLVEADRICEMNAAYLEREQGYNER